MIKKILTLKGHKTGQVHVTIYFFFYVQCHCLYQPIQHFPRLWKWSFTVLLKMCNAWLYCLVLCERKRSQFRGCIFTKFFMRSKFDHNFFVSLFLLPLIMHKISQILHLKCKEHFFSQVWDIFQRHSVILYHEKHISKPNNTAQIIIMIMWYKMGIVLS